MPTLVWRQVEDKIPSSGYSAPELQRWRIWCDLPMAQRQGNVEIRVSETLDVWSFGVGKLGQSESSNSNQSQWDLRLTEAPFARAVLFQICTGEVLFEQNVADDKIVRPLDEMRK